jgi:hypothetical protein
MDFFWPLTFFVLALCAGIGFALWRQLDRRAASQVLDNRESVASTIRPDRLPPD